MKIFGARETTSSAAGLPVSGSPGAVADYPAEQTLALIRNAGTVRKLSAGEPLVREGTVPRSLYVLLEGTLVFSVDSGGERVQTGSATPGVAIGSIRGADVPVPFTAAAAETAVVVEIGVGAIAYLPPATQLALYRLAAVSSLTELSGAIARAARFSRRNGELVSFMQRREQDAARLLKCKILQEALATVPRLPLHVTDLAAKLLDDNSRIDEIVDSIKNDPSLAGMILKVVNSPYYGLPTKVADYYHATLYLGTNAVYQLVLDSGVQSIMPATDEAREIQRHSFLVSLISYEIARITGSVPSQLATTIGLLHDVGHAVRLAISERHSDAAALMDAAVPARVGAALLESWNIPARVHVAIAHQHDPELLAPSSLDESYRREVAILYLAHLCEEQLVGAPRARLATLHADEYVASLGVKERTFADFYRQDVLPVLLKHRRLPAAVMKALHAESAPDSPTMDSPIHAAEPGATPSENPVPPSSSAPRESNPAETCDVGRD